MRFRKEGLRVSYSLSGGANAYAGKMMGELNGSLEEQPEISNLTRIAEPASREQICRKK